MYKNEQELRHFNESFILRILAELSAGKYSTRQLSRIYRIGSSAIKDGIR